MIVLARRPIGSVSRTSRRREKASAVMSLSPSVFVPLSSASSTEPVVSSDTFALPAVMSPSTIWSATASPAVSRMSPFTLCNVAVAFIVIEPVVASFYDAPENDRFNPRLETSSGAQFDAGAPDNAASPIHPDGTVLLIWSPVTGGAAVIRVNNAGPYYSGRTLDVSRGVAERLGFSRGGVMHLLTVVIAAPSEPESRYVRGRVYPKVRGYLGKFDNLALASFGEPTAREALFQGNAPLPALALSTTQQMVLSATERHFKLRELILALQATPADVMQPDDHTAGVLAVRGDTVMTSLSGSSSEPSLLARVANVARSAPVIVRTVMLASLPPPPSIAPEAQQTERASKRAEPPPPRVRAVKTNAREQAASTRLTHSGKVWFDDTVQADR